jgi:hypothetical protein
MTRAGFGNLVLALALLLPLDSLDRARRSPERQPDGGSGLGHRAQSNRRTASRDYQGPRTCGEIR